MHIIVKGNTHPLNGNYYCQKSRGSVTLKGKMKKGIDIPRVYVNYATP